MYEYDKYEALAQRAAWAGTTGLGVAVLLMAVVASPADAKKNAKQPEKKWAEVMPDPGNGEPLTLIVSLRDQQLDIYRGLARSYLGGRYRGGRGLSNQGGRIVCSNDASIYRTGTVRAYSSYAARDRVNQCIDSGLWGVGRPLSFAFCYSSLRS